MSTITDSLRYFLTWQLIKIRFRLNNDDWGDFRNPKLFSEKVQYRKLYGNDAFYAKVADKYGVRDYVSERIGDSYLIPLVGVFDRLDSSLFASFPDSFVIKATHGCKWNRIIRDKRQIDIPETVRYFNRAVKKRYGWKSGERHYRLIRPRIVVEQLLLDDGKIPWDYNFFCYNNHRGFDYAITITSPDSKYKAHFDKGWNLWEGNLSEDMIAKHTRPVNVEEMVRAARLLSKEFDFVRVDLYNIKGKIYFGELTCTPASGFRRIDNEHRRNMRSQMWELDRDNKMLYRERP